MLKIELLRPHELSLGLTVDWARIQESHSEFDSPYFRPEFTEATAAVRGDVWVGVLEDQGRPVGFLPFHRDSRGVGSPIGEGISDFHGVVVQRDVAWDAGQVIRQCGLKEWKFHAIPSSQRQLASFAESVATSPFIDVAEGFETYAYEQCRRGTRVIEKLKTLSRKIEREIGPLRFDSHCFDKNQLHRVLEWRAQRYGTEQLQRDPYAPWWLRIIERIQQAANPEFAGVCTLLWAGNHLVAGHMGMRSGKVLHYWFPSFDQVYSRYSPGSLLLIEILKNAANLGIARVDLGAGGEEYKRRFMTGTSELFKGRIIASRPRRAMHTFKWRSRERLRKTPLRPLWHAVRALFV